MRMKLVAIYYLLFDFVLYKLAIPKPKKYNKDSILFIGEYFPVRIQRIVKYLKNICPHDLVLYISESGFEPKLIGDYFDRIEIYRNQFHLKSILKSESGAQLVHAFEPKAYFQYIAFKALKKPFIYDIQDTIINYFGNQPPFKWQRKNLHFEKKILQEADGLIAQSLELNEALRLHGIQSKHNRLFFPLYCDKSNFRSIKEKPYHLENTKLVYIGGINAIQSESSSNFLPFIQKTSSTKIQFTIFPSPLSEIHYYKEYKSLENKYSHFKINQSVPFKQLDLTDFHYGVIPFDHENSEVYLSKNKYASTLKFFVYLDMGLPIIISEYWAFPAWICKRYQLGLVVNHKNLENLDDLLKTIDYEETLKNVSLFREKFNLENEISRLINFYNRFLDSKI